MLAAAIRVLRELVGRRAWDLRDDVCAYLLLVAGLSVAGYAVARCGEISIYRMRYEMLSVLGATGLARWFLRIESVGWPRTVWIAIVAGWAAMSATVHGRLWYEYLHDTPIGYKRLIVREMDRRGIRYATSDYWLAYSITFLTDERIVVRSDRSRIREYDYLLTDHWHEAVRISRKPCGGEAAVVPRIYLCPP